MRKTMYYQDQYMGYNINCGPNKPCYLAIIERLFETVEISTTSFTRPIGFHVRYRISNSAKRNTVTDRLNKHYSLKSSHRKKEQTFSPLWVRVTENDPDQDGQHYHLAIILDGRNATRASLAFLFADLFKSNLIEDYKIIPHKDPEHKGGVNLKSNTGKREYFYWLSYIAKVRTKDNIDQTFSSSRLSKAA